MITLEEIRIYNQSALDSKSVPKYTPTIDYGDSLLKFLW